MTRAETDRSLLRAFAYAARLIMQDPSAKRTAQRYETHYDRASQPGARWIRRSPRRMRVHHRNIAHGLAVAWEAGAGAAGCPSGGGYVGGRRERAR